MNPEARLIKAVCRKIVHNNSDDIGSLVKSEDIDWRLLKILSDYHGLGPLLYSQLKHYKESVPLELFQYLETSYYYVLADNIKKDKEYKALDLAFSRKDIGLLPIKGMALLNDVYGKSFSRLMADIDVLVKENDITETSCVLESLGYRKYLSGLEETYWRNKQCHLTFIKKIAKSSIVLDVHWDLDLKRKGRYLLPRLWDRVRKIRIGAQAMTLPSPEDTFFSLVLHKRRFGYILSLKNVVDAGLLLGRYKNNLDWEYILTEARIGGMKASLYFMLSQVRFLLGTDAPLIFMKKLDISYMLKRSINRFIEKNTFLESNVVYYKSRYLSGHFLLYDSLQEPIEYILDIPKEQFAKFYGLKPYD